MKKKLHRWLINYTIELVIMDDNSTRSFVAINFNLFLIDKFFKPISGYWIKSDWQDALELAIKLTQIK